MENFGIRREKDLYQKIIIIKKGGKMGQGEILEVLEKSKKPLSRSEIAIILNESGCNVSHHLKTLITHNEVKIIEINRIQAKVFFKEKSPSRRMRLYYV